MKRYRRIHHERTVTMVVWNPEVGASGVHRVARGPVDPSCGDCNRPMSDHGFIDNRGDMFELVCPGNCVVTEESGLVESWTCGCFEGAYEEIPDPGPPNDVDDTFDGLLAALRGESVRALACRHVNRLQRSGRHDRAEILLAAIADSKHSPSETNSE